MKMMLFVGLFFAATIGNVQADPVTETTTEAPATADSSAALEEENWCEENCTILPVLLPPPPDLAYQSDITITQ
ncbi:MAG: hypothetical protein WC348_03680 [Patescibacteria group bacterium]|jgi:hypothetical protein